MDNKLIVVAPMKVLRTMIVVAACLFFASIAGVIVKYVFDKSSFLITFFDFDSEQNLPTWYSTLLLAIAALILGMIAFANFRNQFRLSRNPDCIAERKPPPLCLALSLC